MKLKLRARILAVGLTLSATTLAIIPGVAEAQGNLATESSGGGANNSAPADNTANQSVGTVQDVNAAPDANTQAAVLDSKNNLSGSSGSSNGGNDPASSGGTNNAKDSIGTVQGVNADPNLNTQVAVLDSQNNNASSNGGNSGNTGSSNGSGGSNSASDSIGTVQGVNASPGANTQIAVLDSENNLSSGSGSGNSGSGTNQPNGGSNSASDSIGTVQGVNVSPKTNTQVAVLDSQNNISSGGGSSGNGSSGNTSGSDNNADGSIGTVQDVNVSPAIDNQVAVLDSQNNNSSSSHNGGTSQNSGGSNNANGSIG